MHHAAQGNHRDLFPNKKLLFSDKHECGLRIKVDDIANLVGLTAMSAPTALSSPLPPTPDNDTWFVDMLPDAASAQDGHVRLLWPGGREDRLHAMWLRDNCGCPDCTNPVTHEQKIDLLDIPDDIAVVEARIDDGILVVTFNGDGHVGRFHPGWLRANGSAEWTGTDDRADMRLWRAADLAEPPTFDGPAALREESALYDLLQAVRTVGLARLCGLPTEENTVERVALRIGPVRESHFERVFNVLSRPDADSNAYTSHALPAHTDMPTRETPHGLQLLHCLVSDAEGGMSVMMDGFRIAEDMREQYPEEFANLATMKWTYANRAGDSDYRWTAPHVAVDDYGRVCDIRFASFSRAPLRVPFEQVGPSYRALRRFLAMTYSDEYRLVFPFSPGDLIVFDNRRILHGRTAFDPRTGDRHLQGIYVDRDDMMSTIRSIELKRRRSALA